MAELCALCGIPRAPMASDMDLERELPVAAESAPTVPAAKKSSFLAEPLDATAGTTSLTLKEKPRRVQWPWLFLAAGGLTGGGVTWMMLGHSTPTADTRASSGSSAALASSTGRRPAQPVTSSATAEPNVLPVPKAQASVESQPGQNAPEQPEASASAAQGRPRPSVGHRPKPTGRSIDDRLAF
jgi:hypothetical protein